MPNFYQKKGNKDFYVDRILDMIKIENYVFCPLGNNAYRINFAHEFYQIQFDTLRKNIIIYKIGKDGNIIYENSLIMSRDQIKDLGLGYRNMCLAHEIKNIKGKPFKKVFNNKTRKRVQKNIKIILATHNKQIQNPF